MRRKERKKENGTGDEREERGKVSPRFRKSEKWKRSKKRTFEKNSNVGGEKRKVERGKRGLSKNSKGKEGGIGQKMRRKGVRNTDRVNKEGVGKES